MASSRLTDTTFQHLSKRIATDCWARVNNGNNNNNNNNNPRRAAERLSALINTN